MPSQLLNVISSTVATFNDHSDSTDKSGLPPEDDISLYDWISSKDCYSLDELVEYVRDDLEKVKFYDKLFFKLYFQTDDTDLLASKANFDAVSKLVKKPEYREIRGIDKRLATLNSRMQFVEGKI